MAIHQTYLYYGLFHATSSLLFVADEVTFTITVIIIRNQAIQSINEIKLQMNQLISLIIHFGNECLIQLMINAVDFI